jgi:Tfp pilus assembly protein PilF
MAKIFAARGELAKAVELYRRALEVKPGFAEVHERLGELLAQQGRRDEAIPHLEEALRLMKSDPNSSADARGKETAQ